MEFCDDEKLLKKLSDSAVLLDQVQKGLNDYLETKRGVFARFYFLSNDDLFYLVGEQGRHAARPAALQEMFRSASAPRSSSSRWKTCRKPRDHADEI